MKTSRATRKSVLKSKAAVLDIANEQEALSSRQFFSSRTVERDESCGVHQLQDGIMFSAFCPNASKVQIAGDFNGWQPDKTPMQKVGNSDIWKVKLPLKAGTYRYRLVVDGRWLKDPCNDAAEPNPYGELNSVLNVS